MQDLKKIAIGCAVAAGAFIVILVVAIWFLLFRTLPTLDASLSLPSEVEAGETVTMVVSASNPHNEAVVLDSIDVSNSFLNGFQVEFIEPEPTDTMEIPIVDQRSWTFDVEVQPGGSTSVIFELRSVMEGHFVGDVDVCNPNQDYQTLIADVVARKQR